jgi:putative peptidoglycan lipid II flippase
VRATLRQSLSMLAFLTLPATAGLVVLAEPIVRLLYERGEFSARSTEGTAAALVFYALGLSAYTSVKVLAPAFYAIGAPRVPLAASALAVGTNLLVNVLLHERFGFRAVALGTALGSIVNALVLAGAFERRLGGLRMPGWGARLARLGLAAGLTAAGAHVTARALMGAVGTDGLPAQLLTGLVPVLAGIVTYALVSLALRLPEAALLWGTVRRHLRGSKPQE